MFDINSENSISLIGYVGKDVTFRTRDDGTFAAYFSLCTNEGYEDESGRVFEKALWHNLMATNGQALRIQRSGIRAKSRVRIKGRIQYKRETREIEGKIHVFHNAYILVESSMNLTPRSPVADPAESSKESVPANSTDPSSHLANAASGR